MHRLLPLLLALTWACGGDDDGGGSSTSGEVTEAFAQYCVATFTEDYDAIEFDEVALSIKAGEKYLLDDLNDRFGGLSAGVVFIGAGGVVEFDVEANEAGELPFTSNCALDETETRIGVFSDVTLYADASLNNPACTLKAGTVAPIASFSKSLAGDLSFTERNTFAITIGGLSSQCGDLETVYVQDAEVRIGDTINLVIPVGLFIAPKADDGATMEPETMDQPE